MIDKNRIEYQFSIPIFLLGLSLILVLSSILALVTYVLIVKDFYIAIVIFVWLLYGLIFRDAILKIIRTGTNIVKNRPALILTKQKLIDNINNQQFNWTEIDEIEEYYNRRSGSYIAIKVNNPDKYMLQEKKYFDRMVMKLNHKYWNGAFAIRPREVRGDKREILENLKTHIEH